MGGIHACSRYHPSVLLLDDEQLAGFHVNLEAEYKKLFGAARILMRACR